MSIDFTKKDVFKKECRASLLYHVLPLLHNLYMQMKAPMKDDMYSEEDNAFIMNQNSEEPLYGSCGTAKAVYPAESVANYCKLRAAQDCISLNWKKIDDEIEALKDKRSME